MDEATLRAIWTEVLAGRDPALVGAGDGALALVDVEDGRILRTLATGATGNADAIALSTDGRLALAGGKSAVAKLWDLETGRELRELRGRAPSRGGRSRASGPSRRCARWAGS